MLSHGYKVAKHGKSTLDVDVANAKLGLDVAKPGCACGAAWQSALAHVLGEHLADDAGVQAHEVVVEGLADTLVRLVDWT